MTGGIERKAGSDATWPPDHDKGARIVSGGPAPDMVNHPPHYTGHPSGLECIEVVRHMGFNLGNAVKYIWRADLKGDAVEDLRKAVFYLQDEIRRREGDGR